MKKIINITSIKQKGGKTVGEINYNNKPKISRFWNHPINKYIIIPLIVVILGGIIVGITLYYITNKNMTDTIFNVTSNDQQGGTTAGQIIYGKQDRELTEKEIEQIEESLPKNKNKLINIFTASQDGESTRFAIKIEDHLVSLEFTNVNRFKGVASIKQKDSLNDINLITDEKKELTAIIIGIQK
jgi:hypothetical protein